MPRAQRQEKGVHTGARAHVADHAGQTLEATHWKRLLWNRTV
jgi:hypothetical protein